MSNDTLKNGSNADLKMDVDSDKWSKYRECNVLARRSHENASSNMTLRPSKLFTSTLPEQPKINEVDISNKAWKKYREREEDWMIKNEHSKIRYSSTKRATLPTSTPRGSSAGLQFGVFVAAEPNAKPKTNPQACSHKILKHKRHGSGQTRRRENGKHAQQNIKQVNYWKDVSFASETLETKHLKITKF